VIDHHISRWNVIPKDTVPVVVYRWETWLIIFREEHRLRMFENRVLREISGTKRELQETKGNCILSSFLTQYYWSDQMEMKWIGHMKCLEVKEKNTQCFS
jgi:hypothetical protein